MHNDDMNHQLIMNLRDVGHKIRFLFEGKGSQKRILIILNEVGTMTQSALTQRLKIKPASTSEVMMKLENAKLIERHENQEDHRQIDIQLTSLGKISAMQASKERQLRHQQMFACLSDEEKETLLVLVKKLNDDWNMRYQENENKR